MGLREVCEYSIMLWIGGRGDILRSIRDLHLYTNKSAAEIAEEHGLDEDLVRRVQTVMAKKAGGYGNLKTFLKKIYPEIEKIPAPKTIGAKARCRSCGAEMPVENLIYHVMRAHRDEIRGYTRKILSRFVASELVKN